MKNVAIFTSSEIQNTMDTHLPAAYAYADGDSFHSTGALEEALLLDGLVVHVASTRERPHPHDMWWVRMVRNAGGQVFWGPVAADGVEDAGIGWIELYRFLGEEWPTARGAPVHWTSARLELMSRGYRLGHTFNIRKRAGTRGANIHRGLVEA